MWAFCLDYTKEAQYIEACKFTVLWHIDILMGLKLAVRTL